MASVLIVGASGFIGRHLRARFEPSSCVATYHGRPFAGGLAFDPTQDDPRTLIRDHGPFDHAYVLMAVSSLLRCIEQPEESYAINVTAVIRLLDALLEAGITPLFTSSDSVWQGDRGGYCEEDPAEPLITYGKHKMAVESYLRGQAPDDHITVRLSKTYSSQPGDGTLLSAWVTAWEEGREIACATDQCFNPIHVEDAAEGMIRLMQGGQRGLFNLCGPEAIHRDQLMATLKQAYEAEVGPLPSWSVRYCKINDFNFPEAWPVDISTRIDKLVAATGFKPRGPREGAIQLARSVKKSHP
uniref:dTDP-4-dehydrorhamnose reductase n=1 Tax=Magnetococcus massalia (strain MO-1) TaxID=451514 RepID=A0A1S7LG03_MAGMO|nr:dTDP-4-dehydrorhamnose reductase [Candidatus Magnetococcus massalia]